MSDERDEELIEQQREHFNAIAKRYEKGRQDRNHREIKRLIWQEALKPLNSLGPRITMLEPMCGYAEGLSLVREMTALQVDYHGFDYSDEIVGALEKRGVEGKIWQADATRFRPDLERYDLILLIGGLHHVPRHARQVVKSLSAGLRPGGLFVNFEPTAGNPLFKAVREAIYRRNEIFDEDTERAFGVGELNGFFEQAGLEKERVLYPGLSAYTLYYNPYAFPGLNLGSPRAVRSFHRIDRLFQSNLIGRTLSFATLGIWKKPS